MSEFSAAVLAAPGLVAPAGSLVAYYPLEGATGNKDSGPNALSELAHSGAAGSMITGGAAPAAGVSGSWTGNGEAAELKRAAAGGDAMRLAKKMGFGIGLKLTAPPTAQLYIAELLNSWKLGISTPTNTSWNGGYKTADIVTFGEFNFRALANTEPGQTPTTNPGLWEVTSSPATAGVYGTGEYLIHGRVTWAGVPYIALKPNKGVEPGTDPTTWQPYCLLTAIWSMLTSGTVSLVDNNFLLPIGVPSYVMIGFDGYQPTVYVNGVKESNSYPQIGLTGSTVQAASDELATGTATSFNVGTPSTHTPTGLIWGATLWSSPPDRGLARYLYQAALGQSMTEPFATRGYPYLDSTLAAGETGYYCGHCGKIIAPQKEGYRTVEGKKFHRGCYEGGRVSVAPAALNSGLTMTGLADRAARLIDHGLLLFDRYDAHKTIYDDANAALQPPLTTGLRPRFQSAVGAAAAILARWAREGVGSKHVEIARRKMEYVISTQVGAAENGWIAAGEPNRAAEGVEGTPYGIYEPAVAYGGTAGTGYSEQNWTLGQACTIYLALQRYVPAATRRRWQQSIVAGASGLLFSSASKAAQEGNTTNFPYYANGNFQVRFATALYKVWLVTADPIWLRRYEEALLLCMYPYKKPLMWRGVWAGTTESYLETTSGGPHAVRVGHNHYVCIKSIAASSGNKPPSEDPTHWKLLNGSVTVFNQTNPVDFFNWGGNGFIKESGASETGDDWVGYLTEYENPLAGPPGVMRGQPGYSGDYSVLQSSDSAEGYLLTLGANPVSGVAASPEVRFRQLANAMMNKASLFPYVAAGSREENLAANPQSEIFKNPAAQPEVWTAAPAFSPPGWTTDRSGHRESATKLKEPYASGATSLEVRLAGAAEVGGTVTIGEITRTITAIAGTKISFAASLGQNFPEGASVTFQTYGASGGYSARHSLADGYRNLWLPVSILNGYRPDLVTKGIKPHAMFGSTVEVSYRNQTSSSFWNGNAGQESMRDVALLLLASPQWPGW